MILFAGSLFCIQFCSNNLSLSPWNSTIVFYRPCCAVLKARMKSGSLLGECIFLGWISCSSTNLHSFIVRKWINQTQNCFLLNFFWQGCDALEFSNRAVIYLFEIDRFISCTVKLFLEGHKNLPSFLTHYVINVKYVIGRFLFKFL